MIDLKDGEDSGPAGTPFGGQAEGPPPAAPGGPLEALLAEHFSKSPPNTRFLFTCSFTKIMKLDTVLLRLCLGSRRENGLYLSIDRPHSFVQAALRKQGVPLDRLTFIDVVSKLTGTTSGGTAVRFTSGGFSLPILDDLFSRAYIPEGAQKHFVELQEMDFLLVDNIAVMLQYTSMERTRRLLRGLTDLMKRFTETKTLLVVDPRPSPDLHAYLRESCDKEIPLAEGLI